MEHGILTKAYIDLDALKHNYNLIKETVSPSGVICVVKADAYGHGAVRVVKELRNYGADFFAVANLDEALEIKEAADGCDIIILGPSDPSAIPEIIDKSLIQTISSEEYANAVSKAVPNGKTLRCHISVDTGMNRIGFACGRENTGAIISVCKNEKLNPEGIFSHFACADEPLTDMTGDQLRKFNETVAALHDEGCDFKTKHIANSAAAMAYPASRLDKVRAGINLYGMNPSPSFCATGYKPVMTFRSTVTHVHTLKAGESVSYGGIFRAETDRRIATVAAGYADGFSRKYSGGKVLIEGKGYAKITGNICMDQFMCDVSELDDVVPGDSVILFGPENRADTLASIAGTINYESLCAVAKRVPRIYTENKEPEEKLSGILLEDIVTLKYSDPEKEGVDPGKIADFIEDELPAGLHSLIVLRHGKVVAEMYADPYSADAPHLLNSISKSFTAIAVMFSKKEGLLDYDDKVCSFFPEIEPDPTNKDVTLRHLLMMCWGHSVNIDECLSAPDPVSACLKAPIDLEPGSTFNYETTASYLLSAVISKVTGGINTENYLEPRFFAPLGIKSHRWQTDPQGRNVGGYGLSLTSRDIARFGLCLLHHGMGIIDPDLLDEATSLRVPAPGAEEGTKTGYGYQFWVDGDVFRADGAFGQFCAVDRKLDLVVVTTAGNPDNARILLPVLQYIIPACSPDIKPEEGSQARLDALIESAVIPTPAGGKGEEYKQFSGKYKIGENELETDFIDLSFYDFNNLGLKEVTFDFDKNTVRLNGKNIKAVLKFSYDGWIKNTVRYKEKEYGLGLSAAWTDDGIFNLRIVYTEFAYIDDLLIGFDGKSVTAEGTRNVSFRPENYRVNGKKVIKQ